MRRFLLISAIAFTLAGSSRPSLAAWPHDTNLNFPVTTTNPVSEHAWGVNRAVSDGHAGIICIWDDLVSGRHDLRAQRIDATGNRLWGNAGVLVLTGTISSQIVYSVILDGADGAIVAWEDQRNGNSDIYAQRLDANGNLLWGVGGVAVCTIAGSQTGPSSATDGAGGAWITWVDSRTGTADIYARHVDGAGAPLGLSPGIPVCFANGAQLAPQVTSLVGLGGCVIVWWDQRTDTGDIYAQFLDDTGTPVWATNGVAICTATNQQNSPVLVNDGGMGVVVAWNDSRNGTSVYAQHIDVLGMSHWGTDGMAVSTATGLRYSPALARDENGGVVVVFSDERNNSVDIYAQRLSIESGARAWFSDVAVCTQLGSQQNPLVVADGTGGTYVAWLDLRQNSLGDIYAQRLSVYGFTLWNDQGVPVAASPTAEYGHTLVSAGADGCILQLVHEYNATDTRVAAQKVDRWGYLGAEPAMVSVTDVPNDQGGQAKVSWTASPLDTDPLFPSGLQDYVVFRSVPASVAQEALVRGLVTDSAEEAAERHPNEHRLLLHTVSPAGVASFWETIGQQDALHLDSYSMVAPTTGDSVGGSNPLTEFMVQAHGWMGEWWNSGSLAGYSVDNLAPATPAPFLGQYSSGTAMLSWGANVEADLAVYRLYRGLPGFTPSSGNLLTETADTTAVDAAGQPFEYKLTAVDSHGNESAPATLIPDGTVGVGEGPAAVNFLAPPAPQPARLGAGARIGFGLAHAGHASLSLFDVQGRRIATLVNADLPAGRHSALVGGGAAASELAAGLYLVRLDGPGFTATRRLIVVE